MGLWSFLFGKKQQTRAPVYVQYPPESRAVPIRLPSNKVNDKDFWEAQKKRVKKGIDDQHEKFSKYA